MRKVIILIIFSVLVLSKNTFSGNSTPVIKEEVSRYGHRTIGIDESNLSTRSSTPLLRFSSLGTWDYNRQNPDKPPEPLKQMNGREVKITGFMYPLDMGQDIKNFCLLRTTQTCCYGPKPQYNQYVFVEMNKTVSFERVKPVVVTGKFFIDPRPSDGYIYRLEGTKVESSFEEKPGEQLSSSVALSNSTMFSFTPLETLEPPKEKLAGVQDMKDFPDIKNFPESLTNLEGKLVTANGYIVARAKDPLKIVVGKYWWDGLSMGTSPTYFNSMLVILRKGEKVPSAWTTDSWTFTGTFHVCRDKNDWTNKGIIRLEDAVHGFSKKQ